MLLLVDMLCPVRRLPRSCRLAVLVLSAGMLLRVLSSLTVGSHLLCVVCRLPRASCQSYLRTYPVGWTYDPLRAIDIHYVYDFGSSFGVTLRM